MVGNQPTVPGELIILLWSIHSMIRNLQNQSSFCSLAVAEKARCDGNTIYVRSYLKKKEKKYPLSSVKKIECLLRGKKVEWMVTIEGKIISLFTIALNPTKLEDKQKEYEIKRLCETIRQNYPDIEWSVPEGVFTDSSLRRAAEKTPDLPNGETMTFRKSNLLLPCAVFFVLLFGCPLAALVSDCIKGGNISALFLCIYSAVFVLVIAGFAVALTNKAYFDSNILLWESN